MIRILGEGKGSKLLENLKEKLEEIVKKEIGDVHVNVILVSEDEIKELNQQFRSHDQPTDVLTFLLMEEDVYGEIYVCPMIVEENAKEFSNTFEKELLEVVIHGILHLAGYDHEFEDRKSKEMFEKQKKYVEEVWGEWRSDPSEDSGPGKR
jgi:probable rRNA maturation factor